MTKKPAKLPTKTLEEILGADWMKQMEAREAQRRAEFREPQFPISRLTKMLGIPEPTLRNWLTAGKLELDAEKKRKEGGWRRFSVRDAVLVAARAELSPFIAANDEVVSTALRFVEERAEAFWSGRIQARGRTPMTADTLVFARGGDKFVLARLDPNLFEQPNAPTACVLFDVVRFAERTFAHLGFNFVVGTAKDMQRELDRLQAEERKAGDKKKT